MLVVPARRHRRCLGRGRRRTNTRRARAHRPGRAVRRLLAADGPGRMGHRDLRPARAGQPDRDEQLHRGRAARDAAAPARRHRRHRLRRRIPRARRGRGLRRDKGGTDQPARVPAHARRPDRRARDDHLPRLRPHRPHRRERLPDAVHHRRRRGRAGDLRRAGARAHRDRLPPADGAADEDRAPRPRPRLDGPMGAHLTHPVRARPATHPAPANRRTP